MKKFPNFSYISLYGEIDSLYMEYKNEKMIGAELWEHVKRDFRRIRKKLNSPVRA